MVQVLVSLSPEAQKKEVEKERKKAPHERKKERTNGKKKRKVNTVLADSTLSLIQLAQQFHMGHNFTHHQRLAPQSGLSKYVKLMSCPQFISISDFGTRSF